MSIGAFWPPTLSVLVKGMILLRLAEKPFLHLTKTWFPRPLLLVLLLTVCKGLLWIAIIPPWQTPDEPTHFAYVQYMGEQNRIPVLGARNDGASRELHESFKVLPRRITRDQTYDFDRDKLRDYLSETTAKNDRLSSGSTSASGYPPLYYGTASLVYRLFVNDALPIRVYAVRVLSLLLSLVTVWAAYFIGIRTTSGNRLFAMALATITSLHPQFSMLSSSVNNDGMMIAISALAVLWLLTVLLEIKQVTDRQLLVGAVLFGLGMLVKAHMLYMVLFCTLAFSAYHLWAHRSVALLTKSLARLLIPAALLYSGWAYFSWTHYGSVLGEMGFQPDRGTGTLATYLLEHVLNGERMFRLWVEYYWAWFGWLDVPFNSLWLYRICLAVMVLGLAGIALGLARKWKERERFRHRADFGVLMAALYLGNILFLYAVEAMYYTRFANTMLQGRYLFTSLVPFNVVILLGIGNLLPNRARSYAHLLLVGAGFAFNVASMLLQVSRYYGVGVL